MAAPAPSLSRVLPAPPAGWHHLAASPLDDGRLALLLSNKDINRAFSRRLFGRRISDPYAIAKRAKAEIWLFDGEIATREVGFDLLTPYPLFDRCPDGRWLVISGIWRSEHDNARLIDLQGCVTSTLRLGHGIGQVQVDRDDVVWCGWFDEGVFGNVGWSYPGKEWPPSSAGIAAFDLTGTCLAEAPPCPVNGGIADCYALNVSGGAAWACTYTGFPLLRMKRSGDSRYLQTGLSGTFALAVQGEQVLAAGSYDRDRVPFTLFALTNGETQVIASGNLLSGRPENRRHPDMYGRGPWLHIIEDGVWLRWNIAQFLEQRK